MLFFPFRELTPYWLQKAKAAAGRSVLKRLEEMSVADHGKPARETDSPRCNRLIELHKQHADTAWTKEVFIAINLRLAGKDLTEENYLAAVRASLDEIPA